MKPWRHWTVRSRMVLVVASLCAIALIAADVAGMVAIHNNLIQRVDNQLNFPRGVGRNEVAPPPNLTYRNQFHPGPDFRVYQYTADGVLIGDSAPGPTDPQPKSLADLKTRAAGGHPFTVPESKADDWRARVFRRANGDYVYLAVSLKDVQDTQDSLLAIDVTVTAIVLLLIAAAAATVVRAGLNPLTRMEDTAAEIAGGGDLSQRVIDADPHTESGRLGTALNTMLDRIQAAAEDSADSERRLRQFLADAAHELRTPLTSIQGFAELYRRGGAPPGPALDEAMSCIEADVGRMRLLVNDLLLLAKLDEERPLERHPVDLLAVAADAVRDAHVRVPTRFVQLSGLDDTSATWEPVAVLGDEPRIRQVAANLVSNALQHTPEDSKIVIRVGRVNPNLVTGTPTAVVGADLPTGEPLAAIEVSDTGPGMSELDAQRVFERLYRADGSRTRRTGGAGLGLAIVAAIVQAHGGRVELWTAPQEGARFRVILPAEPPAPDDFE
jgi:two-component system, OmpR family, sensor kinase